LDQQDLLLFRISTDCKVLCHNKQQLLTSKTCCCFASALTAKLTLQKLAGVLQQNKMQRHATFKE